MIILTRPLSKAFLYVDFLDTSGTLLALVLVLGIADENGDFPRSRQAFAADACATIVGSFFGLSPVTSYIESAAGVEAGSRTGMTAVFCGVFFLLSIFLAPIIASIPPCECYWLELVTSRTNMLCIHTSHILFDLQGLRVGHW